MQNPERRDITERYRITRKLGESSRTSVHVATDTASGAVVVLKRIAPGRDADAMSRFLKHAAALGKLRHPTLPSVLDYGLLPDGGAFLILEPVAGRGLEELHGAAPAEVLSHLLQITDGLELLGDSGLAHGNLTPSNVRLATTTTGEQPKLLGLGTRLLHPPIAGMPEAEFAAPEQLAGGTVDGRADVFSFARIACFLLDVSLSYSGDREPEIGLPLGVSFELEDAEALRQILLRCARVHPADRPSWVDVREALRAALRGPVAQPSVGDKTNPVYIPPSTDGDTALRFEESFEAPHIGPISPPESHPEVPPEVPKALLGPDLATPVLTMPELPVIPAAPLAVVPEAEPRVPDPPSIERPSFAGASALPPPTTPAPPSELGRGESDLLPSVEDFLAGPPPVTPPPPPQPAGAPAAQRALDGAAPAPATPLPTAPIAPAQPTRQPSGGNQRAIVLAAGILIGFGALVAFLIYLRDRPVDLAEIQGELALPPPATDSSEAPPPVQSAPIEIAAPAGNPALAAARSALDAGDQAGAKKAIEAIDPATLTPEERDELETLRQSVGRSVVERLGVDLKSGLRTGNVSLLRSTLRGIKTNQAAFYRDNPNARGDVERAQRIVDLSGQLQKAAKGREPLETIRLATSLLEVAPRDRGAPRLREAAAAAIESDADRLVQSGQAQAALGELESLRSAWPDRAGLAERIARARSVAEIDPRLDRILANAQAARERRRPDEGLSLLRNVNPTGPYVDRFRELTDRLKADLAQIDQNAPTIELREGSATEFDKGATTRISLRVTDDFQVARVTLFARPEGGTWQALELRQSGAFYTAELSPAFHQNKNVQWYATATDGSGHAGQLGSEAAPRTLKRKKWFDRLRGGEGG